MAVVEVAAAAAMEHYYNKKSNTSPMKITNHKYRQVSSKINK
jgi:hypothetical protein